MTSWLVPANVTGCAVNCRSVIAKVRVSGGHLCEAEAPTEPAGETADRCAAIRFPHPVIAVRVSGGHLCEAEAPTEPAGETAARQCGNPFQLISDLMCFFKIMLMYCDRERSSRSASFRIISNISLSTVMRIFSFNGFIISL